MAENWKIEKGLCRCCHSEGSFQQLSDLCTIGSEEGYYSDILRLTLNITIQPVEEPLLSTTYTICDDCIHRVRDATAFKQQVLRCEARFHEMYTKGVIKVEPPPFIKQEPDTDDQKEDLGDFGHLSDDDNITDNVESEPVEEEEIELCKMEPDVDLRRSIRTKKPALKPQATTTLRTQPKVTKRPKKTQPKPKASRVAEDSRKDSDDDEELMKFTTIKQDGKNRYKCDVCGVELKSQIKNHIKRVHLETYKCYVCEEKFKTKKKRKVHLLNCHRMEEVKIDGKYVAKPAQKVSCDVCKKEMHKIKLLTHMSYCHKLIKCRDCPVQLLRKDMIRHIDEIHNITKPKHTCGVCGFKTHVLRYLIRHQRTVHLKERTVPCPHCDQMFFDNGNLRRHMVMHNPVKKFECSFCKKKFPRNSARLAHEKIHTGDKRKVCEICGEKFVQKASLNYHMVKHHPEAC